ncbi:E3 ubiquitin-protein ligase TRIM71-like [Anneissia japonica]|uniref:E3 ubiquitin-protein ligase TRIM71-like n=1 Tax=Anneissia japonica TaxID=1529436 RepID=UPI0014255E98|nr:E3 ubiquitin-protein ligase TRIM71-like [Anneissia japonica]XP_033101157.1 E3 ubiquitin-protein ligase TRIM71-like [Anneissia japonica]
MSSDTPSVCTDIRNSNNHQDLEPLSVAALNKFDISKSISGTYQEHSNYNSHESFTKSDNTLVKMPVNGDSDECCRMCKSNRGTSFCTKCECLVCDNCREMHNDTHSPECMFKDNQDIFFCSIHPQSELLLFCKGVKCQEPICSICHQTRHRGDGHDVITLTHIASEHRKELDDIVSVALKKHQPAARYQSKIRTAIKALNSNANQAVIAIETLYQDLRDALTKLEREEHVRVEMFKKQTMQQLEAEEQRAKMMSKRHSDIIDYFLPIIKSNDVDMELARKTEKPVLDAILREDFKAELQTKHYIEYEINPFEVDKIKKLLASARIGQLLMNITPGRVSFEIPAVVLRGFDVTIKIKPAHTRGVCRMGGLLLRSNVAAPDGTFVKIVDVTDNLDGSYSIRFKPHIPGSFKMAVNIQGCPKEPAVAIIDVLTLGSRTRNIEGIELGDIMELVFLFVNDKDEIVVDNRLKTLDLYALCVGPDNTRIPCMSDCMIEGGRQMLFKPSQVGRYQIFSSMNGLLEEQTSKIIYETIIKDIKGIGRISGVVGICSKIFLLDSIDNERVIEFDLEGTHVQNISIHGKRFEDSLITSNEGSIYLICSTSKTTNSGYKLHVYDHSWNLQKSVVLEGVSKASGITVSCSSDVLVSDLNLHCVHVFTLDSGKAKRTIGHEGSGVGEFKWPSDLCINIKEELLVCDAGNRRIQVLDVEDNVIRLFDLRHGFEGCCDAITVSPGGVIVASDTENKCIILANMWTGDLLHTIPMPCASYCRNRHRIANIPCGNTVIMCDGTGTIVNLGILQNIDSSKVHQ